MEISQIYSDLSSAKYKSLYFFEKNVYARRHDICQIDIEEFEHKHSIQLPSDFKEWWLLAGCGEIVNNSLLIGEPEHMLKLNNAGILSNHICLATDELRNYYVCNPNKSKNIYMCDGHGQGYCKLADTFLEFLVKLKKHEYNVYELIVNLELQPI